MTHRRHNEKIDPGVLERFFILVLETPQTPDLIARVAADANFVRLCQRVLDRKDTDCSACWVSVCRRYGVDEALIRNRLAPVARALRIFAEDKELVADRALLGVEPGADADTLKRAFRKQALCLHPDTTGGDAMRFINLKNAYQRLSGEAAPGYHDPGADPGLREGATWVESASAVRGVPVMATGSGNGRGDRLPYVWLGIPLALGILAFGFYASLEETYLLNGFDVEGRKGSVARLAQNIGPAESETPLTTIFSIFYSDPHDRELAESLVAALKKRYRMAVSINRVLDPGTENRLYFHPEDRQTAVEVRRVVEEFLNRQPAARGSFWYLNRGVAAMEAGDRSRGSMAFYLSAPAMAPSNSR